MEKTLEWRRNEMKVKLIFEDEWTCHKERKRGRLEKKEPRFTSSLCREAGKLISALKVN